MNLQQVIADIENRNNRTLAAIERWVASAVDSGTERKMTVTYEWSESFTAFLWVVQLAEDGQSTRTWWKPTLLDALAHAASYCQEQADG